jgi:osmotically-inducible protein OsmY
MKKLISILGLGLIAVNLGGCAAAVVGAGAGTAAATGTDTRGFNTVVSDQVLEHKVNDVLSATVPDGSFTVASYGHQVLVAGQVPSVKDRAKAETAVANTNDVAGVWSYMTVNKNESLSDIAQDTYLTSAAKSRLIAQSGVNTNNIKVVTCAGVVYLLGKDAGDKTQVDGAVDGIKQISGIKGVVNLIK